MRAMSSERDRRTWPVSGSTMSGAELPVVTSGPSHGTVSVNPVTGEVTYTPEANYNGPDSFVYTVQDDDGATSNPATVSLTVSDVNDAPVGLPVITGTVTEDQTLILNSGHPLGLFPSPRSVPRLVLTCGMMVPNYSSPDDYLR